MAYVSQDGSFRELLDMPFVLLLLLALTCLPVAWPEPPEWLGMTGSVVATWAGILLLGAVAVLLTWRLGRRLAAEPVARGPLLRQFNRLRRKYLLLLMGYYLLALFALGWGYTLHDQWPGHPQHVPGMQLML